MKIENLKRIIPTVLVSLCFLMPAQLLASSEGGLVYNYVATKDGIQLSEDALNSIKYPNLKPLYMVKSKVQGGLSPKESEEAHKFLHLQEYEHALMKIEGQDKSEYYITERTNVFHNNVEIEFSVYLYMNKQADLVWQKIFEQEGYSGGCYDKQQRKKEMKNRGDGRFPNKIISSSIFRFSEDRARISMILMNCEMQKDYLEYVEFTARNGHIFISNY